MKIQEVIYNYSPVFLQNILISVYGFMLYKKRYKGKYSKYYNQVLTHLLWSDAELSHYISNELVTIINKAKNNTQFYNKLLKNIDINDSNVLDVFSTLPVLSKKDVIDRQMEFVSRTVPKNKLLTINTSGTTGAPLNVYTSDKSLQINYAYFSRFLHGAELSIFDKSCTFAGRVIVPSRQKGGPYWRHNYRMNTLLFSSYHISNDTIPEYINKIEKFDPVYIDSYPSAISQIANYILNHNIHHSIQLKAVITSSETLSDSNRESIEKAFNCKVYDQYGCAEMVGLITECKDGNYHVNSDYGYLEILNDNGKRVDDGCEGEMVFTGFINDSMPLIRYRIGDTAISSHEKCTCGLKFPVIKKIMGRNDDYIVGFDGRKVGRLDPIFKGAVGIQECQIVQKAVNEIVMIVVKSEYYEQESMDNIVLELKKRVGKSVDVKIKYVYEIPRTKSGKFRSVISEIH